MWHLSFHYVYYTNIVEIFPNYFQKDCGLNRKLFLKVNKKILSLKK